MIGNDIVDLGDPELCPELRHTRFDARVYAPSERAALEASGAPERLRWIFWAAKEAAYKVARKIDPRVIFSPPRFRVELAADLRGSVQHDDREFCIRVDEAEGRVHALATDEDSFDDEFLWKVIPFDGDVGTAGKAVRALARRELATHLDVQLEDLEVERVERIPVLLWDGKALDLDLSLSHHGRFLAFGCDLRPGASAWRDAREPAWTNAPQSLGTS